MKYLLGKLLGALVLATCSASPALAKAKIVYGQCKGSGCEVVAVDGVRALGRNKSGELRAFFAVNGYDNNSGKIEWSDEMSVEWAFCSLSAPLTMWLRKEDERTRLVVGRILAPDEIVMAGVTSTRVWYAVCGVSEGTNFTFDEGQLDKLEREVRVPADVLE